MLIHLNGMPGVGKFTVAKLLAEKLNARLIDNHLLIDVALTVCQRGSTEYFNFLKKLTDLILDELARNPGNIFVFTNALSAELEEDRERLDYLAQFSQNHNIEFVQVFLNCDFSENKRRLVSANRTLKSKLMDPGAFEDICKNHTIYHPPGKQTLEIDTTDLSAEQASGQIRDFVEKKTKP